MKNLKKFPHVFPIVLTNGRVFKDFSYTRKVVANAPYNTVYAIPLYSAVPQIHDTIVGHKGAFKETIAGLHNLVRFKVPIEIRIVLMKQVIPGLTALSDFIGWNFPMAVHVAFMGMEVHGRAAFNQDKIWIEPIQYMDTLYKSVKNLDYRGLDVSIYNLPLCLLPETLRKYSMNSISDWKDGYITACENCTQRKNCAGFFTTSDIIPQGVHHL